MTVVVAALCVVVAVLALLVAGLLRSHAVMLRRLHEAGVPELDGQDRSLPLVPPDQQTPRPNDAPAGRTPGDLTGVTPGGDPVVIAVAGRRHDTSLLFLSSDCLTCQPFWEAVGDGRAATLATSAHRLVVVTRGPESELAATIDQRPADVPVIMSSTAWEAYEVPGSPYFVHVDGPTGRVRGEGTSASWEAMVDLAGRGRTETAARFDDGDPERGRGRRRRRDDRPARDSDEELHAIGLTPDDPSLWQDGDGSPGLDTPGLDTPGVDTPGTRR